MSKAYSKKMYEGSPKTERDAESGKMKVTKGVSKSDKETSATEGGTAGMPEHEQAVMKLHQKHSKERMDMHHKHEKEHMALMHKGMGKHGAEGSAEEEKSESKSEADKEGD